MISPVAALLSNGQIILGSESRQNSGRLAWKINNLLGIRLGPLAVTFHRIQKSAAVVEVDSGERPAKFSTEYTVGGREIVPVERARFGQGK